jgi:hypothetical protein
MKHRQGMKEINEAAEALRKAEKALQKAVNKALPIGTVFHARRNYRSIGDDFIVTREAGMGGAINARNLRTGTTWWNVNPSHTWTNFTIIETARTA